MGLDFEIGNIVGQFDLQGFLFEMRKELREGHDLLSKKVDNGFDRIDVRAGILASNLNSHEMDDVKSQANILSRLILLEEMHENVKWFMRTAVGALVLGVISIIFSIIKAK